MIPPIRRGIVLVEMRWKEVLVLVNKMNKKDTLLKGMTPTHALEAFRLCAASFVGLMPFAWHVLQANPQ
jgi:hypothetical protein